MYFRHHMKDPDSVPKLLYKLQQELGLIETLMCFDIFSAFYLFIYFFLRVSIIV